MLFKRRALLPGNIQSLAVSRLCMFPGSKALRKCGRQGSMQVQPASKIKARSSRPDRQGQIVKAGEKGFVNGRDQSSSQP